MDKVSVLMSVYKEPYEILDKAIRSILQQTYREFEYIIILDNPDNSEAISLIRSYDDSRIKLFINDKNLGLVRSLNKGIKLCSGEYIARMDADDISMPTRLEKQIEYIVSKNLDVIGTDIEIMSDETIQGRIIHCPMTHRIIKRAIIHDNCVKHPAWMIRKAVYEQLAGYRDVFTCEDYDFLIRAIMSGYRLGNCGVLGIRYRQVSTSISRANASYQHVVFDYLRKKYQKQERVTEQEIDLYIHSAKGQASIRAFDNYCKLKRNKAVFRLLFNKNTFYEVYHRGIYKALMLFE